MSSRLAGILLVRFLLLWLAVRALLTAVGLVASIALPPSLGVSMRLAVLMSAIAYFDMRRRGERILLGNLGVGVPSVIATAFVVAIGAEVALGIAWSGLTP